MLPPSEASVRPFRYAALLVAVIAGCGIFLSALLRDLGMTAAPIGGGIFFRLFALYETLPLLLVLVTALAVLGQTFMTPAHRDTRLALPVTITRWVALAILLLGIAGAWYTGLTIGLSMDEFNAGFQARIFARGRTLASVPSEWHSYVPAMKPVFVAWLADRSSWVSAYLPVASVVRAAFDVVNLPWLMNPLCAAISLLALTRICKEHTTLDVDGSWAVLFVAASSQFILTSMTAYAMPLHALASIVWLRAHLAGTRGSDVVAAAVGAIALGLHNPFPHALFVAPFLLRMLRERRWDRMAVYVPIYAVACIGWWMWFQHVRTMAPGSSGLSSFAIPSLEIISLQLLNLGLLVSWQVPVVSVLVLAALRHWRVLPPALRDLASGLLGTFAFYFLFPHDQGHGWGYRYVYACLPGMAMLASWALGRWREASGDGALRLALASLSTAVVLGLPYRLAEARSVAAPYVATLSAIRAVDADVLVLPVSTRWYAVDLIRNDPWLERAPIVMARERVDSVQMRDLRERLPGRVVEWDDDDLARLGLEPVKSGANR